MSLVQTRVRKTTLHTTRIGDLAEALVIPVARVCTATADDEVGLEEIGRCFQTFEVDQSTFRVHLTNTGSKIYQYFKLVS